MSKVIELVVRNNLCIGCGLCVYKCPENALQMHFDTEGFLVPRLFGKCDHACACLSACPFNPFPEQEVRTENELARIFLKEASRSHEKIGRYLGIYSGYSNEYRLTSSSGGLATGVFNALLENKAIDHIFSVSESNEPGLFFEYNVASTKEDLLKASKTRYFPVTLATVMSRIRQLDGKVAVVGVGCFIKAIRLAQHTEPELKKKITFLVGIICGGVKSRFFTEYLAGKVDTEPVDIRKPEFRVKTVNKPASDYSFLCVNSRTREGKTLRMRQVGNVWGTGIFKANACDYCDDVTAELADISLGDAWISPYVHDGRGTNVIVTRSVFVERILREYVAKGKFTIEELPLEQLLASQQGSFNHRQAGLLFRVKQAKKKNLLVPPKRFEQKPDTFFFAWVQKYRMKVRRKSIDTWMASKDAKRFDKKMARSLMLLKLITRLCHYSRALKRKIKKVLVKK